MGVSRGVSVVPTYYSIGSIGAPFVMTIGIHASAVRGGGVSCWCCRRSYKLLPASVLYCLGGITSGTMAGYGDGSLLFAIMY